MEEDWWELVCRDSTVILLVNKIKEKGEEMQKVLLGKCRYWRDHWGTGVNQGQWPVVSQVDVTMTSSEKSIKGCWRSHKRLLLVWVSEFWRLPMYRPDLKCICYCFFLWFSPFECFGHFYVFVWWWLVVYECHIVQVYCHYRSLGLSPFKYAWTLYGQVPNLNEFQFRQIG